MTEPARAKLHAVKLDTETGTVAGVDGRPTSSYSIRWRWACSCGQRGPWQGHVYRARLGGIRHVGWQQKGAR